MLKVNLNECAPAITFEAPAGLFRGRLHNVHAAEIEGRNSSEQVIRFVFQAKVPSMANKTVLVGKNINRNSPQFRSFLTRWLGPECLERKGLKTLELRDLIGTPADLEIQHVFNPGYQTPFRSLVAAYPRGSMKLTET